MKIAIPIWNERISPVFDVARRLLLLTIENNEIVNREEKILGSMTMERVQLLTDVSVNVLICGAISDSLAMQIRETGVNVILNICGSVEEIVNAFLTDRLDSECFMMPGCCQRRRRFHGCR
jgi:predicted Fe-Mo cluster-binding NifX family protein